MFALPDALRRAGLSARAATGEDHAFLRALFATARLDAPFLAQWPAAEREAFLDSQFRFQDMNYRAAYAGADFLVIEKDGGPVGRLILDRSARDWCLVDIAFLPAARGRGWGGAILRQIQASAVAEGAATVQLHVETGNPVHALYTRLGFKEIDSESGAHIAMEWTCPS